MNINLDDVLNFIKGASVEDLALVHSSLKDRYSRPACLFHIGDKVKFVSRMGLCVTGKIIKINSKTVKIISEQTNVIWNVSVGLLQKV